MPGQHVWIILAEEKKMNKVMMPDIKWLNDPTVFKVNREDAHSNHLFYEEKVTEYGADMPLVQSLNGVWKYSYADNVENRKTEFYKEEYDVTEFDDIKVPGHIELAGYDCNQYINVSYPWEGHEDLRPPYAPIKHNPVSSYVTFFDLKDELKGKELFISFQGVEKAFFVWLNGQFVGYSEDSFTPSEFNITDFVKEKNNKLAVQVFKHSSASWLEDQDFFRFSGIFRDVFLYAVPRTHVRDLFVKSSLDDTYTEGLLQLELDISGELLGSIGYEVVDKEGKTVLTRMGIALKEHLKLNARIKDVLLWSAEVPNLYMLNISIYSEDGELIEFIPQRIGFRNFAIENGVMKINGKRIIFKGVNRHEFSCVNGRAITKKEMEEDIRIIKSMNINAVRTSHYPNHPYWYELCDEFGIYLIDETNLETHGTWQLTTATKENYIVPGSLPEWKDAVVDRAKSMLERDKNHPSVLIWSCGNEAYAGEDILEMSKFFHERNPERVVHYEGCIHDRTFENITDIESRMYEKVADIEKYLNSNPAKPFICCEYMHAMGNSCGGMYKYIELEDKYEMYQGGFIWDFVDQAILTKDGKLIEDDVIGKFGSVQTYEKLPNIDKKSLEFMVGGDFKERPNDNYFCGDGIVFADRKLSPKAQEVKYLYQNIKLHMTDKGVLIVNDNLFESTNDYIFEVRMLCDGKAVWAGSFARDVAAGEKEFVPVTFPSMDIAGEYITECRAILMSYRPWANVGHVAAWGQSEAYVIDMKTEKKTEKPYDRSDNEETQTGSGLEENKCTVKKESDKNFVDVVMGDVCIGVKTNNVHAIFSRFDGLISYKCKNVEMIERTPKLTFFRAVTNNDSGNGFGYSSSVFMGITAMQRFNSVKVEYIMKDGRCLDGTRDHAEFILDKDDEQYGMGTKGEWFAKDISSVVITYHYPIYTAPMTEATIKYVMTPDGKIECTAKYSGKEGICDLPVFGITFAMDKEFSRMEYYARGPQENYCDRCKGARLGIYKEKVADNVTPYLKPQECGNRHDVRWIKVVDEFGHGLKLTYVDNTFDCVVLPYSALELHNAYKINELPESKLTHVSVLGAARGVGGDDSWGAPVHEEFCVKGNENHEVRFVIEGL